ncbi:hypothetical protein [Nitratiruptor sp. SB155-2]|uniref:hypothetical protein n=1 Tax=Nitratiruptor sp. (strain SB155-2) TaxID=387092 RepID=UPI00059DEC8C|nr:hypothetical protein [Nitratiruptor sp. SB155-2]
MKQLVLFLMLAALLLGADINTTLAKADVKTYESLLATLKKSQSKMMKLLYKKHFCINLSISPNFHQNQQLLIQK